MKILDYIRETREEMKHVTWPTRSQAINYAILVVLVSVGIAVFLAACDFIFSKLLTLLF